VNKISCIYQLLICCCLDINYTCIIYLLNLIFKISILIQYMIIYIEILINFIYILFYIIALSFSLFQVYYCVHKFV
jgi:hypothetical protein